MSGSASGYIITHCMCICTTHIVQELCESQGGCPGLSVLTSLLVSVDVKLYWTMLRHWSQLVPNVNWHLRTLSNTTYLYMYVSWSSHVSLSLNVWVSGYILTHCMCIWMSLDPCFFVFPSECLHQWLFYHWLYVYMYVFWSICVFLSEHLYKCLAI